MGQMQERLFHFAWNLHDRRRALICGSLGLVAAQCHYHFLSGKGAGFLSGGDFP
jgi:hypothetical protein